MIKEKKEKREKFLKMLNSFEECETEKQSYVLLCQMADFIKLQLNNEMLIDMIKEKISLQEWSNVGMLIFVVQKIPDRIFIPLLCEIITNYRHFDLMEGVADALYDIADENCIDPIKMFLLEYEIDEDLGYHLRYKFLLVLNHIKTPKAIDSIKTIAQCSNSQLRYLANRLLKSYS